MAHRMQQLAIAAIGAATIASAAAAPQLAKLSSPDRYFLGDAMSANQLEIDASTYAAQQASSDKVRQFAHQMMVEHRKIAAEMQKANDGVVVPPSPTPQPGPNLEGRTGADFDKAYVNLMINYDDAALGRFRTADGPQHGAAIRDMAKIVLPMISNNDAATKGMKRSLDAKK